MEAVWPIRAEVTNDVEGVKPPGSGMRGPVGAEPTSCLLIEGFFLPSKAFFPREEVSGFCRGGYFMENNFLHPAACTEIYFTQSK